MRSCLAGWLGDGRGRWGGTRLIARIDREGVRNRRLDIVGRLSGRPPELPGVDRQETQGEDPDDHASRTEYLPWIEQVLA